MPLYGDSEYSVSIPSNWATNTMMKPSTIATNAGLMDFSAQRRMRMKRVFFMALNVSERISTNKPDGGGNSRRPLHQNGIPPCPA